MHPVGRRLAVAESGAAVERQLAAIQRRGEVCRHQVALALGPRVEAELAAGRHPRRQTGEVREIERPGGQADVEPVDQPRIAGSCAAATIRPVRSLDSVWTRSGSSRISFAVTPPRVASAEPAAAARRLDRQSSSASIWTSVVSPTARSWARNSLNPCVRHRIGRELGGRRRRRARCSRAIPNPPPPVVSADFRSTSRRSQRLAAPAGGDPAAVDRQLVEPAHRRPEAWQVVAHAEPVEIGQLPPVLAQPHILQREPPQEVAGDPPPTSSRLPGLSGARVSSFRTTSVATGGSCSSATSAATLPTSTTIPIPARGAIGAAGVEWAAGCRAGERSFRLGEAGWARRPAGAPISTDKSAPHQGLSP